MELSPRLTRDLISVDRHRQTEDNTNGEIQGTGAWGTGSRGVARVDREIPSLSLNELRASGLVYPEEPSLIKTASQQSEVWAIKWL
jgi:hypothetical protein